MPNYIKRGATSLIPGAGGGVTQVEIPSESLGTREAAGTTFVYDEVSDVCERGLVSRLTVTPSGPGKYDLEVRKGNGTGPTFIAAVDVDGTYDISVPVYVEGDTNQSIWIGIKNKSAVVRTYTLTALRVEKFA